MEVMAVSKDPRVPIRGLSILVAVLVGCILAYAYQMNLPSFVYNGMSVPSLLAFVTIPMLAGFTVGIIYPEKAVIDGLYTGLSIGVVNSIMAALKLFFKAEQPPLQEVYAFGFFTVISIFLWMIVAATTALPAKSLIEELGEESSNPNTQKRKSNPRNIKNSDLPNCRYQSQLSDALVNNTPIPDACLTCTKATQCLGGQE